jgi:hypothetical protein
MRGDFNYGDEIVIETPACVNVEVCQSLDGKQVTKRRHTQLEVLQKLSSHRGKIMIPLVQSKAHKNQRNTISLMDLPSNPTQKYRFMTLFHSNWDSL